MNDPVDLPNTCKEDLVRMICGDYLGGGVARRVFAHGLDPRLVVKVEVQSCSFQNIAEWHAWEDVQHTKWADWFAPCHYISPCGTVLLQSRTKPAGRAFIYPKRLPNFFTDLKPANVGLLKGRLVVHDYGLNLLASLGLSGARMRRKRIRSYSTT